MLLFAVISVSAQKKYDTQTTVASRSLEGKSLSGYSTGFDFDKESVRRGWWEFARDFGSPLNMKEYYKVTVPSSVNEGNVDLVIYTQTEAGQSGVVFFLGVEGDNYKEQTKSLLLDFKKDFYIGNLLDRIDEKERRAKSLSSEYADSVIESRKEELLDQLTIIRGEIDVLKEEIRKIEKS